MFPQHRSQDLSFSRAFLTTGGFRKLILPELEKEVRWKGTSSLLTLSLVILWSLKVRLSSEKVIELNLESEGRAVRREQEDTGGGVNREGSASQPELDQLANSRWRGIFVPCIFLGWSQGISQTSVSWRKDLVIENSFSF